LFANHSSQQFSNAVAAQSHSGKLKKVKSKEIDAIVLFLGAKHLALSVKAIPAFRSIFLFFTTSTLIQTLQLKNKKDTCFNRGYRANHLNFCYRCKNNANNTILIYKF